MVNTRSPRADRLHAEGVVLRHQRRCPAQAGDRRLCSCTPTFQAQAWSPRDRKTIRKSFPTLPEARAWRQEAQVALRRGSPGTDIDHARGSGAGLVRANRRRRHPDTVGRSLQTGGTTRLQAGTRLPRAAALRAQAPHGSDTQHASRLRRRALVCWPFAQHDSKHSTAATRDLPPRAPPRRRGHQPNAEAGTPRGARQARPNRTSRRSDRPPQALPNSERCLWATALYAGLRDRSTMGAV